MIVVGFLIIAVSLCLETSEFTHRVEFKIAQQQQDNDHKSSARFYGGTNRT